MNQQEIDHSQQAWIEGHATGRALQIGCGMKPIAGAVNVDPNPDRASYTNVRANSLWLPFRDQTFDSVVSSHVIPHIHNPEQALLEMARVLRPGGVMAHVIPDLRYAPRRRSDRYPFADQPFGWHGPDDFRPVMDGLSDVLRVVTLENFEEFNWSFKLLAVVRAARIVRCNGWPRCGHDDCPHARKHWSVYRFTLRLCASGLCNQFKVNGRRQRVECQEVSVDL